MFHLFHLQKSKQTIKETLCLLCIQEAIVQPQMVWMCSFSNSLIIHQVKTKEIITITMVWKCDLNLWFYFFVYSLVIVSIAKIYQTLETVFYHISKHLEYRQKYSAARRIFNSLLSVWKCDETLSFMFDILLLKLSWLRLIA